LLCVTVFQVKFPYEELSDCFSFQAITGKFFDDELTILKFI